MSRFKKKKKGKSYHFSNGQKDKKGLNYICSNCKAQEIIAYDVLEEFDMMYPEQLFFMDLIGFVVVNVKRESWNLKNMKHV